MSNIHPITLPKWGLEMSEGTVTAWHLAEGADAEKGAELVDIETEKIVNTLDLERAGTVRRLLAQPGDVMPVGALIAVLAPASVSNAEIDKFIAGYAAIDASFEPDGEKAAAKAAAVEAAPAPASAPAPVPAPAPAKPASAVDLRERNEEIHATPLARRLANQHGVDLASVTGTGRSGRISQEDVERAIAAAGGEAPKANGTAPVSAPSLSPDEIKAANEAVYASPIARKVADKLGVALTGLAGTGRKGRVSLGDVEKQAETLGLAVKKPAPVAPEADQAAAQPATPAPNPSEVPKRQPVVNAQGIVPFTAMRRSIAQTLVRAKQTVPHFYTTVDIEADALLALRAQINSSPVAGVKVSVNDFMMRAAALALKKHPDVNVYVFDEGIRPFEAADISMAVAIEGGLVTPVIRAVDSKSVTDIARSAQALAEKARARTLSTDEVKGATFTVSNLGMFGVREFDAVINPPQAAILAVGGVRREAREKDGGVVFVSVFSVTLSADHRAVDGAMAARYLVTLRELIEQPLSLLM